MKHNKVLRDEHYTSDGREMFVKGNEYFGIFGTRHKIKEKTDLTKFSYTHIYFNHTM